MSRFQSVQVIVTAWGLQLAAAIFSWVMGWLWGASWLIAVLAWVFCSGLLIQFKRFWSVSLVRYFMYAAVLWLPTWLPALLLLLATCDALDMMDAIIIAGQLMSAGMSPWVSLFGGTIWAGVPAYLWATAASGLLMPVVVTGLSFWLTAKPNDGEESA